MGQPTLVTAPDVDGPFEVDVFRTACSQNGENLALAFVPACNPYPYTYPYRSVSPHPAAAQGVTENVFAEFATTQYGPRRHAKTPGRGP
jgi:hypothetical protein